MKGNSSELQRKIMAVTAVVAGVMMIYVFPEQAMRTLKIALENVMERLIPFDPDFYTAVPILSSTYGAWMVILVLCGALSICIAPAIYKGQEWARATAMGMMAVAAVSGMTMLIPWMVLVVADYSQGPVAGILPPPEGLSMLPPVFWTLVFGLAFYYVFLFADKETVKQKFIRFIPYTFLGIVAGMVFMNAQHGVRYFIFIPELLTDHAPSALTPLGNFFTNLDHYEALKLTKISQAQINAGELVKTVEAVYDPNTLVLLLGGYLNYIASYLIVLAVPFLWLRKPFAYYMVLAVSLATATAGINGYIVRNSFEWGVGGMMSLALFTMFLIPIFRKQFFPLEEETNAEEATA